MAKKPVKKPKGDRPCHLLEVEREIFAGMGVVPDDTVKRLVRKISGRFSVTDCWPPTLENARAVGEAVSANLRGMSQNEFLAGRNDDFLGLQVRGLYSLMTELRAGPMAGELDDLAEALAPSGPRP